MIYSLNAEKFLYSIPYIEQYNLCRANLREEDYEAITAHLNKFVEETQIQTSSWIPGANWEGTVFEPIYSDACFCDPNLSAKFFGQLLWEVIMNDEKVWTFGRYEKDGIPIDGLTYFVLSNPPENKDILKQPVGLAGLSNLVGKYKK